MGNSFSYGRNPSSTPPPPTTTTTTTTATLVKEHDGDDDNNNNNNYKNNKVICIDCEKKNQKDLPTTDSVSSSGQPCAQLYAMVSECMSKYEGQISSCTDEWDNFRKCHQQQQRGEKLTFKLIEAKTNKAETHVGN
jgi:hypothetical protein